MTNADVARAFDEIADLLEIKGEDSFRVNSYRRVARSVADLAGEITQVAQRGELATLAGVGKASAEKIQELLTTGRIVLREELAREVPISLLELRNIPGLGPKKIAVLWKERGITSLDDLKQAIADGKLAGLKGFAEKSIQYIRDGLEFLARVAGRTRLGVAWQVAELCRENVKQIPGVSRVEHAGSLRRGQETVGDLDLLCVGTDGAAVIDAFTTQPGVTRVLAKGDTKGSVLLEYRSGREIQVDLRVVPSASFGAAWQYFTGSKAHNVRLREMAQQRGWTLNEYALSEVEGGKVIAAETEPDIYAALGLPCFPPELREDRGEFELQKIPKDLLTLKHIRGDLHMHTTASDGHNSAEEMALAAKALGYEYICVTDHSQSSAIANGLKPDRLKQHIEDVRRVAKRVSGITIWIGAEVDILGDGQLDYGDELLAELDWVVASVHTGQGKDIDKNTARTLAAIRNPYVNVIAHPTGRLINRRDAMQLDIETIALEAAATGTALEINASTYRLDLKDQHARLAHQRGARICIDCDAHSTDQFDQMRFGVVTARRAGLRAGAVLNTHSAEDIRAFVAAKRSKLAQRKR
ncbi:MAG: DNA polymerase/3'-5' exonuclease PolX [Planctomycetes bacterium]|nr:DNA polymerase/3'-5' exonuclease PolX [Planctomycetota bacterium]